MPDFSPSIYPSGMTPYQPPNALQQAGTMVGIKNALLQNQISQQTLQQQQIQTQQAQDIQGALGELKNYSNPQGGYDYNAWLSNSVAPKYPLAAQTAFDIRNKNAGAIVTGAYNEQGQPIVATPESTSIALGGPKNAASATVPQNGQQQPDTQQTNSSNPFGNVPTASGGLAPDPLKQRDYYQGKLADNDVAQRDIAPLENVYSILKKNPDNQGAILGAWNTYLAQHNINVNGSTDAATALQITKDHAAQLNLPHSSDTDSDSMKRELANLNPADLGGSLLKMIPYLIGTRMMTQHQTQYLQKQEPYGTNPSIIGKARATLQPLSDARIYELKWLQQNNPAAFQERVSGLSNVEQKQLGDMSDAIDNLSKPQQAQ